MKFEVANIGIPMENLAAEVTKAVLDAAVVAGRIEATAIMNASKELVPVDQGVLRASADAVGVQVDKTASSVVVEFGYGGAASAYSILQHETPPDVFSHAPGKSWKFLEIPTMAATDGMEGRLRATMTPLIEGGLRGSA